MGVDRPCPSARNNIVTLHQLFLNQVEPGANLEIRPLPITGRGGAVDDNLIAPSGAIDDNLNAQGGAVDDNLTASQPIFDEETNQDDEDVNAPHSRGDSSNGTDSYATANSRTVSVKSFGFERTQNILCKA